MGLEHVLGLGLTSNFKFEWGLGHVVWLGLTSDLKLEWVWNICRIRSNFRFQVGMGFGTCVMVRSTSDLEEWVWGMCRLGRTSDF